VYIRSRTALVSQVRGFLAERGIVVRQEANHLRKHLALLIGDDVNNLYRKKINKIFLDSRMGLYTKFLLSIFFDICGGKRPKPSLKKVRRKN